MCYQQQNGRPLLHALFACCCCGSMILSLWYGLVGLFPDCPHVSGIARVCSYLFDWFCDCRPEGYRYKQARPLALGACWLPERCYLMGCTAPSCIFICLLVFSCVVRQPIFRFCCTSKIACWRLVLVCCCNALFVRGRHAFSCTPFLALLCDWDVFLRLLPFDIAGRQSDS